MAYNKNPSEFYKVAIEVTSDRLTSETNTAVSSPITAMLPSSVSITFASDWFALLSNGLGRFEGFRNMLSGISQATMNLSLLNQKESVQIWKGTSPIALSLPLEFIAVENGNKDVMQPIYDLTKLAMPSRTNEYFFEPPGPNFREVILTEKSTARQGNEGGLAKGDLVTISIGKYLTFDRVIITSVDITNENLMMRDGIPQKVTANVSFQTALSLSISEVAQIFNRADVQERQSISYVENLYRTTADTAKSIKEKIIQ